MWCLAKMDKNKLAIKQAIQTKRGIYERKRRKIYLWFVKRGLIQKYFARKAKVDKENPIISPKEIISEQSSMSSYHKNDKIDWITWLVLLIILGLFLLRILL